MLIFLSWLLYTASYMGKVNYSANITQIMDQFDVSKADAGLVPTFLFFSYGAGQVVNGLLCKHYPIKWMVFASMLVSAAVNFLVATTENFEIIKWLWMVNGVALSVLWPSLVRLLAEYLPQSSLGKSSVIMGTTVAAGTLATYGLSALFAAMDCFRLSFFVATGVCLAVGVLWVMLYPRAVQNSQKAQASEKIEETKAQEVSRRGWNSAGEKKLFVLSVILLCYCAVGVNLIKDGLTTWVPSILKEAYDMPDALSILLTLCLPVVAIFGNALALKMHNKLPDYVSHCCGVFVLIGLLIGMLIGCLSWKQAILMLVGLIAVNLFASSLNSLITSLFPMLMREKVNSGLYAGVLNGFCYVGSTISAYGLGYVADGNGWEAVFWLLLAFCGSVAVLWGVYAVIRKNLLMGKRYKGR